MLFSLMAENMVFMMVTTMLKNFYLYLVQQYFFVVIIFPIGLGGGHAWTSLKKPR